MAEAAPSLLVAVDGRGVATLTLNRPEIHNAFDEELIARLEREIAALESHAGLRALVLEGAGKSFSAGADLNMMKRAAAASFEENKQHARDLARMLDRLDRFPRPTLAVVHGATFGGGVGLVAVCDVALAAANAVFSLSEVRLGIAPAVVGPYVIRSMGARQARRWFLTGERFDAIAAQRSGLVHEVVPADQLAATREALIGEILKCSPNAQEGAKKAIERWRTRPIDRALQEETAQLIADLRVHAEGREGIAAFLEKREPKWRG